MEEKPTYFAIIPANVRYDNSLRANEKLLYGEITALSNKTGECWVNNEYFCKLYDVKENAIATWIRHLKEKEYISIEYQYKNNTKEIEKRRIKICGIQKDTTSYSNEYEGGIQKGEDNNTRYINNTSKENNISNDILKEIVNYLNLKSNKSYKWNTRDTQKLINARTKEGFTIDDFKKVIDNKTNKWLNTDMEQYLRPTTLFGTKFESYLNEKNIPRKETQEEKTKRLRKWAEEEDKKEEERRRNEQNRN